LIQWILRVSQARYVRRVAMKCDLCGGAPRCVEGCPTEALTYVEREEGEDG